ncbi:helix-turn-helix domain-containing protein [Chryseobacterium sp. T20]|uniref:helix-turn-helix domain-containing protein n=1 Tax=Chryseobacterium sp. T20 TaxID=3395375 RepID=UPI0039BD7DE6
MINKISTENFPSHFNPSILHHEQFNAYKIGRSNSDNPFLLSNEMHELYAITLISGNEGILSVSGNEIPVKGNVLVFMKPDVQWEWYSVSELQMGYVCAFNHEFIDLSLKTQRLASQPFFDSGSTKIFTISDEQTFYLKTLFDNIIREAQSDYMKKYDILRNYIHIIIHEALKVNPQIQSSKISNSTERICSLFNDLLDQQYKIDLPNQTISLRCPQDYADQLMIHVNHLNKTLKKALGKNTTALIADRTAREAKSLLLSTHWDISQIAYCLGFEHLSNFNRFFKKHYSIPPCEMRSRNSYSHN